jgi:hypothetical protein
MTLTTPALLRAAPATGPASQTPHPGWWWLVAAGWLAQVALRTWAFWHARAPAAYPDEAGYLLAARWLAGRPGGDLSHLTFYQGGYPLLLSPVYWVTADPETVYRLVTGIGAITGATVFPLSVAILRRLNLRPSAAVAIAFAVALLPANLFFGAWALTDAILPAVVTGWLLALIRFADAGRSRTGSVASLAAVYAYAVHSRGIVILLAHAGVLIRAGRRGVCVAALATAGAMAGTALAVVAYAGPRLHEDTFVGFDFPEIVYLTANRHSLDLLTAGLVAGTIGACVVLLRRWPACVAAVLLIVNGGFLVQTAGTFVRPAGDRPAVTGNRGVEVSPSLGWGTVAALRYRVGWTTVEWLSPAGPRPETCTVVTAWHAGAATATWPDHPAGWKITDREPDQWVTWHDTRCR